MASKAGAKGKQAGDKGQEEDHYQILGVARGVGQTQIKSAYRRLAIQLHPDKNPGNAEVAERFSRITNAYGVLSNPEKRLAYDAFGKKAPDSGVEEFDYEKIGVAKTFLVALMSRFGAKVNTKIPDKTLDLAKDPAARSQGIPIEWGAEATGTVKKNGAQLFSGEISAAQARAGVRIHVRSQEGSKFKLLFFSLDDNGALMGQEASAKDPYGKGTTASATFAAFDAMHVGAAPWIDFGFQTTPDSEKPPPIFRRLETLSSSRYSPARPGKVLMAVQGDNFFAKVNFSISFSLCNPAGKDHIRAVEATLGAKKASLAKLEEVYWEAKGALDRVLEKVKAETHEVDDTIMEREKLYADMAGDTAQVDGILKAMAKAVQDRIKAKEKKQQKEQEE